MNSDVKNLLFFGIIRNENQNYTLTDIIVLNGIVITVFTLAENIARLPTEH